MKATCKAHDPERIMNWFYKMIISKPKTLDVWEAIFEKNEKSFTKFLTMIIYDVVQAFYLKSVCIAVSNTPGVKMEEMFSKLSSNCYRSYYSAMYW